MALRVEAHRALAETFDSAADADRRAWHLATISAGPDEHVAAMLADSAERVRARGGFAAMAAACERAATLSPDPEHRGRRLLAAADAGRLDDAGDQAARAADFITDPVALARVASVRATVADEQHRPRSAHRILTDAGLAADGNPGTAGYLLFRAVDSAIVAGDLAFVHETAERTAQRPEGRRALALARMATGFGSEASDEIADGVRALRELIDITEREVGALKLRETALVPSWYWALGDDVGGLELADRLVQHCREQGAIGVLPLALCALSRFESSVGRQYDALGRLTEADATRHFPVHQRRRPATPHRWMLYEPHRGTHQRRAGATSRR
ncbi:hypothetical protein [Saccharopolyspora sp. NPDC050642]|uniref:hypothetical protein n=1 Tax=Saccharopolyspora sp. NPDC050642 TaxID=3157099 RepID=UPI0033FF1269